MPPLGATISELLKDKILIIEPIHKKNRLRPIA